LELSTDRRVGKSTGAELAGLGFGDAKAGGLEVGVSAADPVWDGVQGEGLSQERGWKQDGEDKSEQRHGESKAFE
jgi:hypothetical protein